MIKILLTGGSGMVGKNILEHPSMKAYEVLAPSSQVLDLRDYLAVDAYLKKHQPDFIIHAAGLVGGIQANISRPVDFLIHNLEMGKNVMLAANANSIKKVMNLASSCMYPKEAQNPLNESLVLRGALEPTNEGYALAKIVTTKLCEYLVRENSELQYKTVIPCNIYGKYDKFSPEHSHMVPAVIKKIYDAKENQQNNVQIWGDGMVRREFMLAEDLADFVGYAIKNFDKMPQNINLGLGFDYTINEYYQTIAEVIGYEGNFVYDQSKPVGMKQKLIDDTKLKQFGWQHKTSLKEGIKKAFEYYKNSVINDKISISNINLG